MTNLQQNELTGCKVIGAITELGHAGPKHYGIILGQCLFSRIVYIAEKVDSGDQVVDFENFKRRYECNGKIVIQRNVGKFSDLEVAQRALKEATNSNTSQYDLITNNCESFSNRAMHDHTVSGQVVNTVLGCIVLAAGTFFLMKKGQS
jgi:hypothetical protein